LAVRLALGSSAASLVRHALTESLLLAALGGAGGLTFALWGRHLLLALMPPTYLPVGYDLGIGIGVFAATAAVTVVVGLLVGMLPAWRALHTDLNRTLRSSGLAGAASRRHVWARQALVAGQIALALVLLIGASLCVRSFVKARRVELGFEPRGVWLAGFRLNPHKGDDEAVRRFYQRLRTGCAQLPGVTSAALSSYLPLGLEGVDQTDVTVPGYAPQPGESLRAGVELVSPGYFQTMGMRLLAGREFTETDDSRAPLVAVVNEAFAQRYFPGRDPVGLTFTQPRGEVRVIGVSATGKYRSLAESPFPYFYLCASQYAERNMTLALRTTGEPTVVASSVTRLALTLDPETPPHAAQSCEEYVAAALTIPRVAMTLLSTLGFMAVALAVIGCYAVMAQGARERTRELGVRAALGASPSRNLWLMLSRGLVVAGVGVGIGIVLGAGLAQALASLLVGVSAADPATWLLAPVVLVITVLTACWLPSHRAAHADPMAALRCD
jgi:predicted permease